MKLPISNGNLDEFARENFKKNKSSALSIWLIASYCYYRKDFSILSDSVYDNMAKWMHDNWDNIEHVNKDLVDKGMLKAGSAFNISEASYPTRVKVIAEETMRDILLWENLNGYNQLK